MSKNSEEQVVEQTTTTLPQNETIADVILSMEDGGIYKVEKESVAALDTFIKANNIILTKI